MSVNWLVDWCCLKEAIRKASNVGVPLQPKERWLHAPAVWLLLWTGLWEGASRFPLTAHRGRLVGRARSWIVWIPSSVALTGYNTQRSLGRVTYSKTSKERTYKCRWVLWFTSLQIDNRWLQTVKNEQTEKRVTVLLCNTCTEIQDLQGPVPR